MTLPAPILLAEDEEADVFMLRRALQKAEVSSPLVVVRDGQEAIDYLSGAHPYSDRATYGMPGLLILDLKMPRMSGFEVLAWLAQRPDLNHIPAVVMSSSSYDEDIQIARELGAREYHVKPTSSGDLVDILKQLSGRWLQQ